MNRDRLTRERRSWNMSRIRGKDTAPEKVVRSMLHRMGYRFRLNVKIPIELGKQKGTKRVVKYARPDSVLPKYKTVIFIHGGFCTDNAASISQSTQSGFAPKHLPS